MSVGNKPCEEILRINKDVFKYYLKKDANITPKELGENICRSGRSIKRYLSKGEMPVTVFFEIADYMKWSIHEISNIVNDCAFIRKKKYAEWMIFLMNREIQTLER